MKVRSFFRSVLAVVAISLLVSSGVMPASAQNRDGQSKILGGFFEEWSIYYAGYNLANLESNGSAAKLSHLIYAFGDVTASATDPTQNSCVIADAWADFETKQLHPQLKTLISLGGASAAQASAFSTAASTQAGRQALAASCISIFI